MSNNIRTPKAGKTVTSRRIAEAVDDETWQEFRVSMKGTTTGTKLRMLMEYYLQDHSHSWKEPKEVLPMDDMRCDICIRLDNYIKALCRGGQLYEGESLVSLVEKKWYPRIKKM